LSGLIDTRFFADTSTGVGATFYAMVAESKYNLLFRMEREAGELACRLTRPGQHRPAL